LALYLDAVLLAIISVYFEAVFPRTTGVPKHPLFCFFGCSTCGSRRKSNDTLVSNYTTIDEDSDVTAERNRINQQKYEIDSSPLILANLTKEFVRNKQKKVAVNHLCLVVGKGECFGLLGENGAGKTTTISMATGFQQPTLGTAFVAGNDVRTDIDKVHLSIGVCPQFSILWEGLTVEEHLLFYARLKGVSPSHEAAHVSTSLRQFGLTSVKDRQSQALSGGMQRRVSVAISLVGHSKIVFLDEPTTGLDPASKRQLWKIISAAKANRAIILTTHNMTEAELLCKRVSIMTDGEMRCLGTPLHLKNKFADGIRMHVNVSADREEEIVAKLKKHFGDENIHLLSSFKGNMELKLVAKKLAISDIFAQLQEIFGKEGVVDWSLNQIGLEEVFQTIVRNYKQKLLNTTPDLQLSIQ
jgi:ABC-type multidrug transport system ATPase subunit